MNNPPQKEAKEANSPEHEASPPNLEDGSPKASKGKRSSSLKSLKRAIIYLVIALVLVTVLAVVFAYLYATALVSKNSKDDKNDDDVYKLAQHRAGPQQRATGFRMRQSTKFHSRRPQKPNVISSAQSTDDTCAPLRQCSRKFKQPPLVVISLDGFRDTYLDGNITPAIQRLVRCGTRSKFLIPSFPSKTFPNHYAIATGLLPAWSGIIDNAFYDPTHPEKIFKKSHRSSGWYFGEPIWNAVQKHGMKSAVFFWPGSEALVNGVLPNYYQRYDSSVPFTTRIDTLLGWLNYPEETRPSLMQVYLEEPDAAGHVGGPDSQEVRMAVILTDATIRYLTDRLLADGLMGCINIVILSDHGMQRLNHSRAVILENFLPTNYRNYLHVFTGIISHISDRKDAPLAVRSPLQMVAPMRCPIGSTYLIYRKKLMPTRYHYGGASRVGDVIIEGRAGVTTFRTEEDRQYNLRLLGNHGFDNRHADMRTLFAVIGPDVHEGKQVDEFQNTELYNLFADLLRIPPGPTNGTRGLLYPILKNPPPFVETPTFGGDAQCVNPVSLLSYNPGCQPDNSVLADCKFRSSVVLDVWNNGECIVQLCDAAIHYNKQLNIVQMIETTISHSDWGTATPSDCMFPIGSLPNKGAGSVTGDSTTVSLFINKGQYNAIDTAHVKVTKKFANGVWQYLVNKVDEYVSVFGKMAMYAGPAYDRDADGIRDGDDVIRSSSASRIFVVLVRCPSDPTSDPRLCADPLLMPFVLPIIDEDFNCLEPDDFLFEHTARIRDVELISGFQFFTDRSIWPIEKALQLRTRLVQKLWSAAA